ncbi:MAG: thioredoxin fold domain-containing protein [Gammaproteobacteria bacterium]|nr:thioredoxin fold domain-containing protein [Gammaproteobacteria bacterium]
MLKLPHNIGVLFTFCSFIVLNCSYSMATEKKGKFLGAMETEYPAWFKESFLDFNEDIAEASLNGKRLMLLFHQNGCPYCNALVNRNLSQKDIETKVKKNFDVIAINMWGDRELTYVDGKSYTEKTLAAALKVQFTPTTLFYDENGKIVLRLNGYREPAQFKIDLDYVANRKEKDIHYREYVKANLAPKKSSKKLHKEDFFRAMPYDLTVKAGESNQPIAIFFEQKDCPNCDLLHNQVLPDKKTRAIIRKFKTIQLDMWSNTPVITPSGLKTTAKEWAKQLDIKYAPSIVLFNKKGEEVIRSEAFFKVFHTQGIFAYVLNENYKKQPSFQRYLTERADHFREQGQNVDIWRYADEIKQ